jgi:hypothetical protein
MPRYYMHVCNGTGFVEDEEGRVLPDDESARDQAIRAARGIMASDLERGELDLSSFIEVENETKELIFTVMFSDAVKLTHRHRPPEQS